MLEGMPLEQEEDITARYKTRTKTTQHRSIISWKKSYNIKKIDLVYGINN